MELIKPEKGGSNRHQKKVSVKKGGTSMDDNSNTERS